MAGKGRQQTALVRPHAEENGEAPDRGEDRVNETLPSEVTIHGSKMP